VITLGAVTPNIFGKALIRKTWQTWQRRDEVGGLGCKMLKSYKFVSHILKVRH
jgi:hypothetical protein